jgi:PST family polysaccharide transporter
LYVGFILRAMGADFYPRLTAAVTDHRECNRLVNEQAEVSLLLAGPGILATLAFTPLVIPLLYSRAFGDAADLLRWICLGATLQVITWPIGYIIVAEGRQSVFFWCEFAYTAIYLGIAWVLVTQYGANGAAMAFFCSYIVHGVIVYPIVRRLTGFRWSGTNWRIGGAFLGVISLVFIGFYIFPFWLATAVGLVATLLSTTYSAHVLLRLVSADRLPRSVRRLLVLARMAPPDRPR